MTIKTHGRMFTDNTVGIPQLAISDGTDGQAIVTDGSGTLRFATVGAGGSVGSSVYVEDIRTGDGTTATFTLSTAAPYEESILVFIDGVGQPTSSFTLPSTTSITFSPAPGNGAAIRICHLGIASSVGNNSITGAKIAMGGDTAGDVIYYNGTSYQRLGIGTTGQHLATNSAANAPEWVDVSGKLVKRVVTINNTPGSSTGNMPFDETQPLFSEGADLGMSTTYAPTSATNRLLIKVQMALDHTVDTSEHGIYLCKDGSDALTACMNQGSGEGSFEMCQLIYDVVAGSTAAATWTVRGGNAEVGRTLYWNRDAANVNIFGAGNVHSHLIIEEYTP